MQTILERIFGHYRTTLVGAISGVSSLIGTTWGTNQPLTWKTALPGIFSILLGVLAKDRVSLER